MLHLKFQEWWKFLLNPEDWHINGLKLQIYCKYPPLQSCKNNSSTKVFWPSTCKLMDSSSSLCPPLISPDKFSSSKHNSGMSGWLKIHYYPTAFWMVTCCSVLIVRGFLPTQVTSIKIIFIHRIISHSEWNCRVSITHKTQHEKWWFAVSTGSAAI